MIFSPLLVFPRIDIIQWLNGFITHVENKVNTKAVYGQIRKNTEADNHTRLVSSLFDDPSSSIY